LSYVELIAFISFGYCFRDTVPSKSYWTICKIGKNSISSESILSNTKVQDEFTTKNDAGYQVIWFRDQDPRFVGPDL